MGETISTCVGVDRDGSYKEYVTDGDSDPYYRRQGKKDLSSKSSNSSVARDVGVRRKRPAEQGKPDVISMDDLVGENRQSNAQRDEYLKAQSVLPSQSVRVSTNRNSDDILRRAKAARRNFRLALMHASDASEAAAVEGRGTTNASEHMESSFVESARDECSEILQGLREEAESNSLFTVASDLDKLLESIKKMETLEDENDVEVVNSRQGGTSSHLDDDAAETVWGQRPTKGTRRVYNQKPSHPTHARLSVVEVSDDDPTLRLSPTPKKSSALRGISNSSRLTRTLWDTEDGEEGDENKNDTLPHNETQLNESSAAPTPSSSTIAFPSEETAKKEAFRKEMEARMQAKRKTKTQLGVLLANREIANTQDWDHTLMDDARAMKPDLGFEVQPQNKTASSSTTAGASGAPGGRSSELNFLMQRVSVGAGPEL